MPVRSRARAAIVVLALAAAGATGCQAVAGNFELPDGRWAEGCVVGAPTVAAVPIGGGAIHLLNGTATMQVDEGALAGTMTLEFHNVSFLGGTFRMTHSSLPGEFVADRVVTIPLDLSHPEYGVLGYALTEHATFGEVQVNFHVINNFAYGVPPVCGPYDG